MYLIKPDEDQHFPLVQLRCVKTQQDLHTTCGPLLRSSAVKIILITHYKVDCGVKHSRHLVKCTPGQDQVVVRHAKKQLSHSEATKMGFE